jgi:6-phosphogluconolactonase (cycloisomerase 2 family)
MAATNGSILAYVATYSSPEGPEGSKGNGKGIYLFEMNPSTGALAGRDVFANDDNPSWLGFDRDATHLYSANETHNGSVSAYQVNRANGQLKLLNTVSSEGAGPTHLSVHPAGKHVLVANYHGGSVAVLPILAGGSLGSATDVQHHQGKVGPVNAASGPQGSFSISGHDHPHAHMIQADPSGKYVLAADLGLDRVFVYKFDAERGKLIPNIPAFASVPPGDGPRHFAFHPNGRWVYLLLEEASTMMVFDYDAANGRLTAKQTLSTLPQGFAGTDFTSEVVVSPDGRFVYAGNRLHDSIAWFSVGPSGTLTLAGEEWTRGDYPRSFTISPTGDFLFSCNQRADAVVSFRVIKQNGALTFTGQYTPVGTPSMLVFLP